MLARTIQRPFNRVSSNSYNMNYHFRLQWSSIGGLSNQRVLTYYYLILSFVTFSCQLSHIHFFRISFCMALQQNIAGRQEDLNMVTLRTLSPSVELARALQSPHSRGIGHNNIIQCPPSEGMRFIDNAFYVKSVQCLVVACSLIILYTS